MKTFQDLLAVGQNDSAKGDFCRRAVDEFRGSIEYRNAKAGEDYYAKHNTTIEKYQKYLYTLSGAQRPDIFSSNYKLKTLFFHRLITQQVQYVLGNGLFLMDEGNKEKLGKDFDYKLQLVAKKAMASGRAFGFWNYDHMEVFGYADTPSEAGFCPLYSEETSQLEAGIRFWFRKIGKDMFFRCTLYEADGLTEYRQKNGEAVEVLEAKKAYKRTVTKTNDGLIENIHDENYTKLPIVQMFANDTHESELVGIRECIDAYDFIKSGLANDIDDTSGFFWVLKNTGGMEDPDLAQFVQRMKTVKATVLDGDDGVDAEAHTIDVPVNARQTMLEILRKDLYEDFQALDVNTLSASAKTTQEIQASYQAQDNKCADFEFLVLEFVDKILELAGIDDDPSFKWNRVVNMAEQTQMILQSAQYLTDDAVIRHLPFLTPEEADEIIGSRDEEDFDQFDDEEPEDIYAEDEMMEENQEEGSDDFDSILEDVFGDLSTQIEDVLKELGING